MWRSLPVNYCKQKERKKDEVLAGRPHRNTFDADLRIHGDHPTADSTHQSLSRSPDPRRILPVPAPLRNGVDYLIALVRRARQRVKAKLGGASRLLACFLAGTSCVVSFFGPRSR